MKLQTELNPDILEINQNIWMGMNTRQLFFGAIGVISAGVSYISLTDKFGVDIASWIAIAIAAVFIFLGFFNFNGLPAEKVLLAIYRDLNNPLQVSPGINNVYYEAVKIQKEKEMKKRAFAKNSTKHREESSDTASSNFEDERLDTGSENI